MIRKAKKEDITSVVKIYDAILDNEEAGNSHIGWVRGMYPTIRTAEDALERGTLFVCEDAGKIVAAAKIDQVQDKEYAECHWEYNAPENEVMVLHTLVVDPAYSKRGYGRAFVNFYEQHAIENNCPYLRMDSNKTNTPALRLYRKMGYREVGVISGIFNDIPDVHLVCFEKKL